MTLTHKEFDEMREEIKNLTDKDLVECLQSYCIMMGEARYAADFSRVDNLTLKVEYMKYELLNRIQYFKHKRSTFLDGQIML